MKILIVHPFFQRKNAGATEKDIVETSLFLKSIGHNVSIYTLDEKNAHPQILDRLMSNGIQVRRFMPDYRGYARWFFRAIRQPALFDRAAYVFEQLAADPVFNEYVSKERPDVGIAFFSFAWPSLRALKRHNVPTVFRSINYEPNFFFEALSYKESWYPSNWLRYFAKELGERKAVQFGDVTATLPFEDSKRYYRWKPGTIRRLTLIFPNKSIKEPNVHKNKKPLDVFYLGASYNVPFHLRGADLLIRAIAPQVLRKTEKAFRFHICGAKLPQKLQSLCDGEHIIYEGYVDDFEAFMDRMDIGAFPVWTGKTMKGKVFESLCRAFPIVIPDNCLGGYDLKHGSEALIANSVDEFVSQIIRLQDETLRGSLAEGAHTFASHTFSNEALGSEFSEVLHLAVLNARPS